MNDVLAFAARDPWFGWILIGLAFAVFLFIYLIALDVVSAVRTTLTRAPREPKVVSLEQRRRELNGVMTPRRVW